MARGDRRHLVTFQNPGPTEPVTWIDLDPPTWHVSLSLLTGDDIGFFVEPAAGTPISSATYSVRGDFHPGVTTQTRMWFGSQVFAITSVDNVEMRGVEMICGAVQLVV
ncbi:MAG: head-tail adaptor protein [Lysobacterales bacterium]|nr:MAG: head-tail adaptor protein [Xanthomonadales bacterium]